MTIIYLLLQVSFRQFDDILRFHFTQHHHLLELSQLHPFELSVSVFLSV